MSFPKTLLGHVECGGSFKWHVDGEFHVSLKRVWMTTSHMPNSLVQGSLLIDKNQPITSW